MDKKAIFLFILLFCPKDGILPKYSIPADEVKVNQKLKDSCFVMGFPSDKPEYTNMIEYGESFMEQIDTIKSLSNLRQVLIPKARIISCHIAQMLYYREDTSPHYRITMLIPKMDTETYHKIQIARRVAAAIGKNGRAINLDRTSPNLWDGDGCNRDGTSFADAFHGNWVLTAGSLYCPPILSAQGDLLPAQDIPPEMPVQVFVKFYAYQHGRFSGIGCGLERIVLL